MDAFEWIPAWMHAYLVIFCHTHPSVLFGWSLRLARHFRHQWFSRCLYQLKLNLIWASLEVDSSVEKKQNYALLSRYICNRLHYDRNLWNLTSLEDYWAGAADLIRRLASPTIGAHQSNAVSRNIRQRQWPHKDTSSWAWRIFGRKALDAGSAPACALCCDLISSGSSCAHCQMPRSSHFLFLISRFSQRPLTILHALSSYPPIGMISRKFTDGFAFHNRATSSFIGVWMPKKYGHDHGVRHSINSIQ